MSKKRRFNISSSKHSRTLTRVERGEEEIVDMAFKHNLQDFRKFILRDMLSRMVEDGAFEFTEEKEGEISNKVFLVNLTLHKEDFPEPINGKKATVFRIYVKEGEIDDTWEE